MIAGPAPVPFAAAGQPGTGASADGGEGFMALLASLAGPAPENTAQQEQPEDPAADEQPEETPAETVPAPVPASLQSAFLGSAAPQASPAAEAPAATPAEDAEAPAPVIPGVKPAAVEVPVPTASGVPVQVPVLPVPVSAALQPPAAERTPVEPQAVPVQAVPATQPQQAPAETVPSPVTVAAQAASLDRPAAFRIQESTTVQSPAAPAATGEPALQAVPVQGPAPAAVTQSQTPQPAAAPAPAQPHVPLQSQLSKPVFTLAAAGTGEHVMTMKVTPEELGTVTVRAVIGPEGVRMELFASDAGRDAVKAIMPDLRRELAAAGFNASLDLGTGARPDSQGAPGENRQRSGAEPRAQAEPGTDEDPYPAIRRMFTDGAASLDVLA